VRRRAVTTPATAAGERRVLGKLGMAYKRNAHHYGAEQVYYIIERKGYQPSRDPYVVHEA